MSDLIFRPIDFTKDFKSDGSNDLTPVYRSFQNNEGTADPSFLEGVTSGLKYQWLPITSRTVEYFTFLDQEVDPDFDFKTKLVEDNTYVYADELARAKNLDHYNYILNDIRSIENNRKMYDRSGFGGALVAGVVDPLNIAFMMPVFNTGVRAAWAAKSAFGVGKETAKIGALFGVGSELLRAPFDPFNTPSEVIANVTANTVFGGLLGGGTRGVANVYSNMASRLKNRTNPIAGNTSSDFIKKKQQEYIGKEGTAKNPLDKYNFIHSFIPARRIQGGTYGGGKNYKEAPDYVRRFHALLAYNATTPLKRNYLGLGDQSVDMAQTQYGALGLQVEVEWRKLLNEFLTDNKGTGTIGGLDYRSTFTQMKNKFGKETETYLNNATGINTKIPTYQEFAEEIIELNILNGNPKWNKQYYDNLPEFKKKAMGRLNDFLRDIDQRSQDSGLFFDRTVIKTNLAEYKSRLDEYPKRIVAEKDPLMKEVLRLNMEQLRKQVKFYEQYNPTRKNYKFPLYYNKEMLLEDPKQQELLTRVFIDHFIEQGKVTRWNTTLSRYVDVGVSKTKEGRQKARKYAEEIVDTILERGDDPYTYGEGVGKGKHLLMRVTDIPEWKVKDFLIKDPKIMTEYSKKMGFRIEFARRFGDEDVGSIMAGMEMRMKGEGYTPQQIAEIKSDVLADFERVAGQMTREPHRWDTAFARNIKRIGGMTYLYGAGISSFTETIAMPIFEHGFGKVFRGIVAGLDGNWSKMSANATDLMHMGEGLEMIRPTAHHRMLHDNLRPVQVGRIEKGLEQAENWFYKANGLAPITSIGKLVDAAIRVPKFYNQLKNYGKNDFDVIELARYGIDEKLANQILKKGAWQETDTGMPLLNINGWDTSTKAARELKQKVVTYFNTASRNTIIHATAFDRPTMMDGFVYKKWRPYMRKMGIEPDPRASVGLRRDGTYEHPVARLESGTMAFPFQFYNFAFAAHSRVLGALIDPAKQHRLAGAMALMAMSYVTLSLKKPDWWFEDKDYPELLMRIVDHSGITGLYGDIFYHGLNVAVASGIHDPDDSWLKGRYKAEGWDTAFGFLGASPSMLREWVVGANDLVNDRTDEGLKTLSYNLPILQLLSLDDDFRGLGETERFRY